MAQPAVVIADARNQIGQILATIERAQAQAAALVQAWNKLGGSAFVDTDDFTDSDITEAEFEAAISSLSTAFPDILGAHGTNLYKLKW